MNAYPLNVNIKSAAEYFGSLIQKPRQGSFKVYVGRVPVGQLFGMIVEEGIQLSAIGLNVAAALNDVNVSTNERQLNVIPAREVVFKEKIYREVDYEEIQKCSPDILLIDDLLHANIGDIQPEFRYKNVKNYLSHGISVISTIYSPWDDNLRKILSYLGNGIAIPVDRWAELSDDEVVALVFTPKEAFSHAELISVN